MIVTMHQPNYLPYLGFFHKAAHAELFVSYDIAQFTRRDFHNRNKVKTSAGATWMTVPVKKAWRSPIKDIEIENSRDWGQHHLNTLKSCYYHAPYFKDYLPYFEDIYSRRWEKLVDLNEEIIRHFLKILFSQDKIISARDLDVPDGLDPTERITWIMRAVGASTFISGSFGREYLDEGRFTDVKLVYQDFHHPTYDQQYPGFIPNLSFIDCLLNMGEDWLRKKLRE